MEGIDSADLALLPRLPDTAEEIKAMALAMNADLTRDVFIGEAANEATIKSLDLAGYKVLAFATHALVPGDLNGLTQPALALSAPEVAEGAGAEAISGLGRAFLYAGARSLLVSNRPVETTSARALVRITRPSLAHVFRHPVPAEAGNRQHPLADGPQNRHRAVSCGPPKR